MTSNSHAKAISDNSQNIDQSLLALLQGTTAEIGEDFFNVFVANLANAYGAKMALVNELIDDDPLKVRTLAFYLNGQLGDNFEYLLSTTPCESVYCNGLSYFSRELQSSFPDDKDLVDLDLHSYLGIPLNNKEGDAVGHICVLGDQPLCESENATTFLKIFSARASAELERLKAEREVINQRTCLQEMVHEQTVDLKQAIDVAEKASQTKTKFLSRMSHELRTPMHGIMGYAELMRNDDENKLSEKQQSYLTNVMHSGNNLMMLIESILDFSQIESGELETILEKCNVKLSVDETISSLMKNADEKGIKIGYADDANSKLSIRVDASRFSQIMTNLISNSIKFNQKNGQVVVNINDNNDDNVRISVTDSGVGIADDERDKIFETFERLEADDKCIGGSGIGLAITKRLVELMDGKIGVDTNADVGTTFWVEFKKA